MSLAGQQHHIIGRGCPDGLHDGARSIHLHVGTHGVGNAGQDLLDDSFGGLGARVVAGHDHVIGEVRGNAAHHGTLARIALAAATEQADQAAGTCGCHGAQRGQRPRQRIGSMGVVHDHQRAAACVGLGALRHRLDRLQAAVDRIRRGQFACNLCKRQAQLIQHARHQQQVGHVVRTQQAGDDLGLAVRGHQRENLALGSGLEFARSHAGGNLRVFAQAVAHRHAGGKIGDQAATRLVVGVDDRGGQARPTEQARLGGFVPFHRAVIVEMVARQIGEGRQRNAHAIHPPLLDADGGCLHGHGLGARVAHGGQRAVHGQHVGGRQVTAQRAAVGQHGAQGADRAARLVIAAQRMSDPLHRRRLAIGTRHRHDRERCRRTAIPGVGQLAQQGTQAGHRQHGRVVRHGLDGFVRGSFKQHSARAQRQRLLYIETSVAGQTRAGNENIARLDIARVQLEVRGQRHARMQPRHGFGNRGDRIGEEAFGAHLPGSLRPATIVDSKGASGRTPISRKLPPTIWENTGAAIAPP